MSDEMRDVGPYESFEQVNAQFENETRGLPGEGQEWSASLVLQALTMTQTPFSQYEREQIEKLVFGRASYGITATIVSGLVYRAWKAGYDQGVRTAADRAEQLGAELAASYTADIEAARREQEPQ